MDNYTYENILYQNQPSYSTPGLEMVPEGPYQSLNHFDEDPFYNPHMPHPYKDHRSQPTMQPMCSSAVVKTEQNTVPHPLYTNSPHTPAQFHFSDNQGFFNQQNFMSNSPSGQPVSPYGNHSVSEGTVSSTVSSPRSPHGFNLLPREEDVNVSDNQLTAMSARDLNKYFKELPPSAISQLKKKRRTLKNRGYALNSRMKRVQQKSELEDEKKNLQDQVKSLNAELDFIKKELESYKRKVAALEGIISNKSHR